MKLQFVTLKHIRAFKIISLFSVLVLVVVLGFAIRTSAEGRRDSSLQSTGTLTIEKSPSREKKIDSKKKSFEQSKTMSEWTAFSIYHPNSVIIEDSFFQNFKNKPGNNEQESEQNFSGSVGLETMQVLGARSLVPILRLAFGDQARGREAAERDPWFLTHPTALFNPTQIQSLCGRDSESLLDDGTDICWKPKLTDEYLNTLTDFASDACTQLVFKEFKQSNRALNKLVRSEQFKEQNLKHFAIQSLKIPAEKTSEEWLNKIISESKKALLSNHDSPLENSKAEENADENAEDLYIMTCQAALLSAEFYAR